MWKKIVLIVIIASVIFSISHYFYAQRMSYNKYVEGEYFFRYKAKTQLAMSQDAWFDNMENYNKIVSTDMSDTKNMLLYGGEYEVYASGPHDGVCTVIYGDKTVEDFPVSNLGFAGDDEAYFNGTKKMTFDEYMAYVKGLSSTELKSALVSTDKMAGFQGVLYAMYTLIGVELFLCFLLFLLYNSGNESLFNAALIFGALFGVGFNIYAVLRF